MYHDINGILHPKSIEKNVNRNYGILHLKGLYFLVACMGFQK